MTVLVNVKKRVIVFFTRQVIEVLKITKFTKEAEKLET